MDYPAVCLANTSPSPRAVTVAGPYRAGRVPAGSERDTAAPFGARGDRASESVVYIPHNRGYL